MFEKVRHGADDFGGGGRVFGFAERRFRQGVDVILLGHFHKPWVDETGGGRVEILPAFVEERRWMEIGDDGATSLVRL